MTAPQADDEATSIVLRMKKMAEKGRARAIEEGRTEPPEPQPCAKIIQLPLWPEPVRGAPNAILRSALFAGIHSKKRQMLGTRTRPEKPLQPVLIAAQTGITIKFTGLQLNQYDGGVFWEALHRARIHPLGTECFFRGYDFLHSIGRSDSALNYEDLHDSLTRMRDGRVEIDWIDEHGKSHHFEGGLMAYYQRQDNKLYKITFAPQIKSLFGYACWTQLEWAERMALKAHPQAQWLHGYFCSHAPPFPVSAAFLHEKSGSRRPLLKHYREDLKAALATLKNVLGWETALDPKTDQVTVSRVLSPSQARHTIRANKTRTGKRQKKGLVAVSYLLPGFTKPD